jgi:hypothetical protein
VRCFEELAGKSNNGTVNCGEQPENLRFSGCSHQHQTYQGGPAVAKKHGTVREVPEDHRKAMVDAYLAGATATQAAALFGYCRHACTRALKLAGIVPRKALHDREIAADLAEGVKRCRICGIKKPLNEMLGASRRSGGCDSCCRDCYSKKKGTRKRQKPPTIPLSISEAAYLAGIVDGEGYLGLVNVNRTRHWFYAQLTIGMTGKELFDLQKQIGTGRIYTRTWQRPNTKPCHVWTLGANPCRCLLPQLLPFLRFKKRQAELVLEYLEMSAHIARKSPLLSQAHRERATAIWEQLKALNKRGG